MISAVAAQYASASVPGREMNSSWQPYTVHCTIQQVIGQQPSHDHHRPSLPSNYSLTARRSQRPGQPAACSCEWGQNRLQPPPIDKPTTKSRTLTSTTDGQNADARSCQRSETVRLKIPVPVTSSRSNRNVWPHFCQLIAARAHTNRPTGRLRDICSAAAALIGRRAFRGSSSHEALRL